MQDLMGFIVGTSEKVNVRHEEFLNYVGKTRMGLLVNERYMNLPRP